MEASIFALRLKLLNFLPSFTANFAPARKKNLLRAAWVLGRPHAPRTAAGSRMGSRTDAKRQSGLKSNLLAARVTPPVYLVPLARALKSMAALSAPREVEA